jgi:vitamin B12 transporter
MNKKVFVIVMAGLLCSRGLLAEETVKSYTSNEVVVTSSRVEELKKNVTSSITVIGREEIELSSAKDLGELLAEKSIGQIQKYPGMATAVGIRGFRSDEHGNDLIGKVLVLLDGRRVGTGNVAKITTANIERIEIIRGPAAVQYGSAAIGGIINVITARGEGSPRLSAGLKTGSYGFTETSMGASGRIGNLDFSGSISLSEMGDYKTGDGTEFANTAYDDQKTGSMNIGYEIAAGHRIGIIYSHFDVEKAGSPGYISQNDLDDHTVQKNRSLDFSYEGSTPDRRFSWLARYFTGEDRYTEIDPVASNPDGSFFEDGEPYISNVDYRGAQGQLTFREETLILTTGVDWLKYDLESTYTPAASIYENPSWFLLGKYGLFSDRLIVSAGMRYDDYQVKILEGEGTSKSTDNFALQSGLAWQASDALKLRTSYSEGFRMPEAQQLAADYVSAWGTHYVGNPALNAEKSRTFEAGLDFSPTSLTSSLSVFTTDFSDKIQSASIGGNMTWVNLGGATVTGIEAVLSCSLHPFGSEWALDPYVNGTYLTEYSDDATGDKLNYTPEWNANIGIRIKDKHGFSSVFNLACTGETMVQNWEDWSGDVVAKGGFSVANLTVSKKFPIDGEKKNGRGLTITGEINNLFDREYQYVKGYPMPGRTFSVGLSADI